MARARNGRRQLTASETSSSERLQRTFGMSASDSQVQARSGGALTSRQTKVKYAQQRRGASKPAATRRALGLSSGAGAARSRRAASPGAARSSGS